MKFYYNYKVVLIVLLVVFTGCASAPVQEMSDARQAIIAAKSAKQALAEPSLQRAEKLLEKAEQALHVGDYGFARSNAKAAREEAIQAQKAITSTQTSF